MQIEIITTKKKLTKSLINQMQRASLDVLKDGTSLGYIINGKKGVYSIILIEHLGLYNFIEGNWGKRSESVSRQIGKYFQSIKFNTSEECTIWWNYYKKRLDQAINQIYI